MKMSVIPEYMAVMGCYIVIIPLGVRRDAIPANNSSGNSEKVFNQLFACFGCIVIWPNDTLTSINVNFNF